MPNNTIIDVLNSIREELIRANDLNTATYNINWTFSGRTSLSVKFLIE